MAIAAIRSFAGPKKALNYELPPTTYDLMDGAFVFTEPRLAHARLRDSRAVQPSPYPMHINPRFWWWARGPQAGSNLQPNGSLTGPGSLSRLGYCRIQIASTLGRMGEIYKDKRGDEPSR